MQVLKDVVQFRYREAKSGRCDRRAHSGIVFVIVEFLVILSIFFIFVFVFVFVVVIRTMLYIIIIVFFEPCSANVQ
ncbi:hypothetical protein CTI14_35125 [Methylobacterium radiotolerans]|nr:hypothetical protein CTI14_35125 [Methylobacterium radiotolerans]